MRRFSVVTKIRHTVIPGRFTKYGIALLAVTLVGLALRVYHLGAQSFWIDEAISVVVAKNAVPDIVAQVIAHDTHPPLYYFILHFWMTLFGTSEFAVRFLSLIFGVLAIPMIYVLSRHLFNKEVGLVSALILALSQFDIQYSQEARMYSMLFLFALISMYFFVRFLEERSVTVSAGYVLSTSIMLYSHFFGLFVLVIQNAFLAGLVLASRRRRSRVKRWLPIQAIIVIIFAPWLSVSLRQVQSAQVRVFHNVDPSTLVLDLTAGIYGEYYVRVTLFIVLLGLAALSLFAYREATPNVFKGYAWDSRANLESVCLLIMWFLGIIGLPFLITPFIEHALILPRYMIVATAPFFILAAKGIRTINSEHVKLVVVTTIVILSAANLHAYYATTRNSPAIPNAVAFVNKNAAKGDLVLFFSEFQDNDMYKYYSFSPDLTARAIHVPNSGLHGNNSTASHLQNLTSDVNGHNGRVWVVIPDAPKDLKTAEEDYFGKSFNLETVGNGPSDPNVRLYVQRA